MCRAGILLVFLSGACTGEHGILIEYGWPMDIKECGSVGHV